ncbi:hypothetical protein CONPUDRAFT_53990 [Coniophora puteana RWD-64-598 SS2]|uniref:Photolyase/cryptochrome alpha/beta domain-containing protein n=1 Tax=Coniophora puteana (strain RWD-64-598) TaxID=741705 RepID=A0A5M3MU36_CONPW|nr:uncharacterized protein CONPUDRAFT_53990 [Coniophora puteana RWD-64-598 SS2]EIW82091.1 hypothetical protein CONPUDRAFT_53990 [Coniophora puteana RWD-64-598 SS2]
MSTSTFNPRKIATPESGAAAQQNLPYIQLVDELKQPVKNPKKGRSVVHWMRMCDLRLVDNRALSRASIEAKENNIPLVILFVVSPQDYIAHDRSARRIDFTLRNLEVLKTSLNEMNIPLYAITHSPRTSLPERVISFVQSVDATCLFANMEYEVDELRRDIKVCQLAKTNNIKTTFFHDKCIAEPGLCMTKDGRAYTVYSPYQRLWSTIVNGNLDTYMREAPPIAANSAEVMKDPTLSPLFEQPIPEFVGGFKLETNNKDVMTRVWPAGHDAAKEVVLSRFLRTKARASQLGEVDPLLEGAEESDRKSRLKEYGNARDRVDKDTTSRLSAYLAAGVISPRECVRATMELQKAGKVDTSRENGIGRWVQEIAWRDFYVSVLAYYPRVSMGRPFQEKMANVVWENNEEHLKAWQEGKTGVPIVDAAMRQLNSMGWMHNRMRMTVAMFLSKDLMLDWRLGERYFMQNLIDGDLASNNGGWQWSASTGVDPAPYFRLFNPYNQSTKGDPNGEYIRHFVPELKNVWGPDIHNPPAKLAEKLGYPLPIVKHHEVRERALRRYKNPGKE